MANGNLYDNRCIVEKYLNHKLAKNGHAQEMLLPRTRSSDDQEERQEESACRANLHRALREAGDELESLYRTDLSQLSKRLRVAPVGAEQRRFAAVTDELFRDGVNWGRVVAFFEFGAMVCVQCAPRGDAENVARWMTEYLNGPLNVWIQENGGWDAFVELYTKKKDVVFNSSWPSLTTVFSLTALGAVGLTIGVYLTHK